MVGWRAWQVLTDFIRRLLALSPIVSTVVRWPDNDCRCCFKPVSGPEFSLVIRQAQEYWEDEEEGTNPGK